MINSKVSAYRKVNDGFEIVSRWDLLKMAEVEYRKFKDENFPLYLRKSEESPKLTFNSKQKTFRFLPGTIKNSDKQSSGLTISHILAQEVLSELDVLNFKLLDKRTKPYNKIDLQIKVENSIVEHSLFNGEYIADLLIYFSEPIEKANNWNRKLVLEVFTSNEVRGKKIFAFEENEIALIEISLGDKLKSKKKISEITEQEEIELKRYIFNSFKKQIFGDLLVSPISKNTTSNPSIESKNIQVEIFEEKLKEFDQEIKTKEAEYRSLMLKYEQLKTKYKEAENLINHQKKLIDKLGVENYSLKKDNIKLNNLSIIERIKIFFK